MTVTLSLPATDTPNEGVFTFAVGSVSGRSGVPPSQMPASIPRDQAYYWSFSWQEDIRESMAALQAGDYKDFDSDDPTDVVRWLLSDDA